VAVSDGDPEELRRRLDAYWYFVQTPETVRVLEEIHASYAPVRDNPDRAADARWLLCHSDFMRVEAIDDTGAACRITFDGISSDTFQDLVIGTVRVARIYLGVCDSRHEARDVIVLEGRFDIVGLEQYLRAWWMERLRQEAA
jgi:hypothetical protein